MLHGRPPTGLSNGARIALGALAVLCGLAASCSGAPDRHTSLRGRPFTVHVPSGYRAGVPTPLVVLLHGYGISGEVQDEYLGLRSVADKAGVLLIEPDGTKDASGKRFWNAGDSCCAPLGSPVDDSTYLSAVIRDAERRYDVDRRRVFVIGHSNGAFMAYRMACDHADQVAAIISFEGGMPAASGHCAPSRPVSVLEIHGTADDAVRYGGGVVAPGFKPYAGAGATVRAWAARDKCRLLADQPAPPPRMIEKALPPATVQAYSSGCAGGGHAELWTQPSGVHKPDLAASFSQQLIGFLLAHPRS